MSIRDMMMDNHVAYRALAARDSRFDGVFFVGVKTTGIYCRPICPAKTPKLQNCEFFPSAEAAEKATFRPCLRCRPELAPGLAPMDEAHRIAQAMVRRIQEGQLDDGVGLEEIASEFGMSSRQLRRIIQHELGVSPIELLQTRRLLLAKQLLTETKLPVTEIAFASGFSSLRRFNDAFLTQYRMPPTQLRKAVSKGGDGRCEGDTATLQLNYRAPYDWEGILSFLRARTMKGVELVTEDSYVRSVQLGRCTGWVQVTHAPLKQALRVTFPRELTSVLPALLERLRHLFDLCARPDVIAEHLSADPRLRLAVQACPGLRVLGAYDGFEMAVRAVIGQQVTVKAATTLASRFAGALGEPISTPYSEIVRLAPTAARVARADVDAIGSLGIIRTRVASIMALAQAIDAGRLSLVAGADPDRTILELTALPGIGPWTAHYIAMRALRWPDAFPKEDIVLRNKLGRVSSSEAETISQPWRPWRSYAVLHLWRMPEVAADDR